MILKQPQLHRSLRKMSTYETLADYVSTLDICIPVRYAREESLVAFGNELVLYNDRFDSCPSHTSLVHAIEKKLSRSNSMRRAHLVVPLCIVLLCSKLYSVNASAFESTDDLTIEMCWEYVELISISVESELREWMVSCIDNRKCIEYSLLYCTKGRDRAIRERSMPKGVVSRSCRFSSVDAEFMESIRYLEVDSSIVLETMVAHVKLMLAESSSSKARDSTNRAQ